MNFRSAHYRRAWASRSRAVRLCIVCAALPAVAMAAPGLAACGRPGGQVRAVSVDPRLDIALSDGRTVRLGGLDAPRRGSRRAGNRRRRASLPQPTPSRPGSGPRRPRRRDRSVGQDCRRPQPARFGPGSAGSTAAALLAAGLARVRPEFETRGCAAERLMIEDGARRAALGVWSDPDFAVIQSSDGAELRRLDGRFVVIEGMVRRVGFARSRLYLELVPHDGPTIVIARKLEPALARGGRPVGALVGETIRARGALDDRFGPRIEVGEPAMIEIARRANASGEAEPHR